jgi:hypothetical protein
LFFVLKKVCEKFVTRFSRFASVPGKTKVDASRKIERRVVKSFWPAAAPSPPKILDASLSKLLNMAQAQAQTGTRQDVAEELVLDIPAHLVRAMPPIVALVRALRQKLAMYAETNTEHELEARFGTRSGGRWVNGVSREFWERVFELLRGGDCWTEVVDGTWKHYHDYFYALQNGLQVRTSTAFDVNRETIEVVHVNKVKCCTEELHVLEPTCNNSDEPVFDIRVSLSTETAVDTHELPESVSPSLVRLKQRVSFAYRCWRFDMTKVWSGASRVQAETKQKTEEPVYEIELECASPASYLHDRSDAYVALSLLLKMCDFLPTRCVLDNCITRSRQS